MTFSGYVALLRECLDRRLEILEHIDSGVLNVRGKKALPGLPRELSRLNEQLAAAHRADGFEPMAFEGGSHELDPLTLAARAQSHWERHRWPGRHLRLAVADRIYSVFILRQLEHLSLRIWDEGAVAAADRLQDVQGLLDGLNDATPAGGLIRDARWVIQTAQGPLTRRLEPYFRIAERISTSFTNPRHLEIHRAGAILTSGHLRSQLRHRASEVDRAVDDPSVLAMTRNSNSMDAALLVRDLVPLLEAYGSAGNDRLDLADAIFQGISADPELFLTRLDLLLPCTMIEDLFIQRGTKGELQHTPMGDAHVHLLGSYAALIARHAPSLQEDAVSLDPRRGVYSPLGIAYGFCADLLSNMALDTLMSQPSFGLSLEDMFASRSRADHKRARAEGWRTRQTPERERNPVDYSDDWAARIFDRTMSALQARVRHADRANASDVADARLFVVPDRASGERPAGRGLPDGIVAAQEHCVTSDLQRALATGATAFPRGQIVTDRNEGRFLASAETDGKWFGISKVVLTLCTSQGQDALITGVPPAVVDLLRLTCPGLVAIASTA
jgi:hypothetical protein